MPNLFYRAKTLRPGMWNLPELTLRRSKMVQLIDDNSFPRALGWIVGPVGSGKTTVALQWAQQLNTEIQYVSVRRHAREIEDTPQPPNEMGVALQNLFNVSSASASDIDVDQIREHLENVVNLSSRFPEPFILDDLEFVSRSAMFAMQELFDEYLPRLGTQRALFISRTIDANVLGAIQASRMLRVILPPSLAFDTEDTSEAQQMGIFGAASGELAEDARERSAGWITGMLADLHGHGGRTISQTSFNATVLNDMLLLQPAPILQCINAFAILPFTTTEIWERWFDKLEVPHWVLPSTLSQIPTRNVPGQPNRFEIVPPLREAILRLSAISVTDDKIDELVMIAMRWYVENNHIEQAINVATTFNLVSGYLEIVKPMVESYARDENWSAIKQLVFDLPHEIVHADPDLHFWMEFALSADLEISEFIHLHQLYGSGKGTCKNPLERGRHELIDAFIERGMGNTRESLAMFEKAYNTLPTTAHQERLYAAASAGNAASHLDLGNRPTEWRNKVAFELSHLPIKQRWWHSDAGPVSLGFLASAGQLALAYNLASNQVESLSRRNPELTWRYLITMATIDIERGNYNAAASALETSLSHIFNDFQTGVHQLVQSWLYSVQGNHTAARNKLRNWSSTVGDAITGEFRFSLAEARIALEAGEPETASLILSLAAWPTDQFSRNFGDPHPAHLLALVKSETGHHTEALSMVREVLEESRERSHLHFEVRSHVLMAHIHHNLGDTEARDEAIEEAVNRNASAGFRQTFVVLGKDVRSLSSSNGVVVGNYASAERLTSRELEVLRLVSESQSNKQIATAMFISISTVKNHLASVYMKLGTNNRRDAVAIAKSLRLI